MTGRLEGPASPRRRLARRRLVPHLCMQWIQTEDEGLQSAASLPSAQLDGVSP
jgi:hypothetical protein